jgi:NAD+ kinase
MSCNKGETMRVGLLGKTSKIGGTSILTELSSALATKGFEVSLFSTYAQIQAVDVVIVLGGDGALLHAATVAAPQGIALVGVNYGNLGFLTEYEKQEVFQVVDLVSSYASGACKILNRSMLQISVDGDTYYALNEVAIQRDYATGFLENPQILKLQVAAENGMVSIAGDGALLTTPTGSTAYSLSAGGAIIAPEVPVFMLTPICAFTMGARPMVFSDAEVFDFSVEKGRALILVDGKAVATITQKDSIRVAKAPFAARFITQNEKNFFNKVKNKLNG